MFGGDLGLTDLVLANPWVVEPTGDLPHAAAIRGHYTKKLLAPAAWLKLATGGVNLRQLARGIAHSVAREDGTLARRFAQGIKGEALVVLADGDGTAQSFAAAWRYLDAKPIVTTLRIATASHSFADPPAFEALAAAMLSAVAPPSLGGDSLVFVIGFGEEALGVERRHAARARRSDRLPVELVHHVAAGEHAGHAGVRRPRRHLDIVIGVEFEVPGEQFGRRMMADRNEATVNVDPADLARLGVAQVEPDKALIALAADELIDFLVPQHLDAMMLEQPLLQDLLGAKMIATVDQRDVMAVVGEVKRLLDGGDVVFTFDP